MEYIKETGILFKNMLVDEMEDYKDVSRKISKTYVNASKSNISHLSALVQFISKWFRKPVKNGNYLVIPQDSYNKKRIIFRVTDVLYIVLIWIIDVLDSITS